MTDAGGQGEVLRPPPADRSIAELCSFGVVNLDKPPGPPSHQVSAWVRETVGTDRAAHAGTLDPKATGCLPVLLGTATRLAAALLTAKEYVAVLELHAEAPDDLEDVLDDFVGPIYQRPPRKSAVSRSLRVREIYALKALERAGRRVLLRVRCESGTYVRKLCHDLGLALGTGAHMGELRRTAAEPFDDTDLVTMHDLRDAIETADDAAVRSAIAPAERAIEHLPAVTIAPSAARSVADGAPVYAPGVIACEADPVDRPLVACFTPDGSAVCLGLLVGDPGADEGTAVELERVLV